MCLKREGVMCVGGGAQAQRIGASTVDRGGAQAGSNKVLFNDPQLYKHIVWTSLDSPTTSHHPDMK